MRLYSNPYSTSARRVVMTAMTLGLDLEVVTINLADPADRQRLQPLNANSKIPVLQDGDFLLWESCAIMQYLADGVPGQTLYPTGRQARADVNRWMFWGAAHFAPAIGVVSYERIIKPLLGRGEADPREIARGEADVTKFAGVLDDHLAGRTWVSGDTLTLADFTIAASLTHAGPAQLPLKRFANLKAWFARVAALEVWQRTHVEWGK